MSHRGEYWVRDRAAPFATFLAIVQTHLNSEADPFNWTLLKRRAERNSSDDHDLQIFRTELIQLLRGDRAGLPGDAISLAADGDDWNTDDEFLTWLWRELYPDEPLPGGWGTKG